MLYASTLRQRYEAEELLRDFFNHCVAGTTSYRSIYGQFITTRIIHDFDICRDEQILDLGCGEGWLCRMLSPLCPEGSIVGLDISDDIIRHAREKTTEFENILYTPGTAEEIPWAENYFSRAISLESAYYWPSPENGAKEIFRVVKPGGKIFLLLSLYTESRYAHRPTDSLENLLQIKSLQEWITILTNAGFTEIKSDQLKTAPSSSSRDTTSPTPWLSIKEHHDPSNIAPLLLRGVKPIPQSLDSSAKNTEANPLHILR